VQDGGGIAIEEQTRKEVISARQRKQDEVIHPYLNGRISLGLIPYVQSLLLARHIRGGLDAYPSFLWR
jgi:CRISPR-associated protein Cas1